MIPNMSNVDPNYLAQAWDKTNDYSVCKNWGSTGFFYDTTKIKKELNTWQDFLDIRKPPRDSLYFFEENGAQSVYAPNYQHDAYLVFGCESKGLPLAILDGLEDRMFHLPMLDKRVRSLNLANVATAVIYQAMRSQFGG